MKQILKTLQNNPRVYPRVYENEGIYIDPKRLNGVAFIIDGEQILIQDYYDPNYSGNQANNNTPVLIGDGERQWETDYNQFFSLVVFGGSGSGVSNIELPVTTDWETSLTWNAEAIDDTVNYEEDIARISTPIPTDTIDKYYYNPQDWVNHPLRSISNISRGGYRLLSFEEAKTIIEVINSTGVKEVKSSSISMVYLEKVLIPSVSDFVGYLFDLGNHYTGSPEGFRGLQFLKEGSNPTIIGNLMEIGYDTLSYTTVKDQPVL